MWVQLMWPRLPTRLDVASALKTGVAEDWDSFNWRDEYWFAMADAVMALLGKNGR